MLEDKTFFKDIMRGGVGKSVAQDAIKEETTIDNYESNDKEKSD